MKKFAEGDLVTLKNNRQEMKLAKEILTSRHMEEETILWECVYTENGIDKYVYCHEDLLLPVTNNTAFRFGSVGDNFQTAG